MKAGTGAGTEGTYAGIDGKTFINIIAVAKSDPAGRSIGPNDQRQSSFTNEQSVAPAATL